MEDYLRWKTTIDGRPPSIKEDLTSNKTNTNAHLNLSFMQSSKLQRTNLLSYSFEFDTEEDFLEKDFKVFLIIYC